MDTSYYTNMKVAIPDPVGAFANIKLIVVDVDGTLTDSGIYYDENGNELKKFSTRDAAGFFASKVCGIKTMVLTGRKCAATTKRMKELQIDYVEQEIKDKVSYLAHFIEENNYSKDNVAYIGDDMNDYECMKMSGFIGCPADAVEEIKEIADYIATVEGGKGAVRDIVKYLLSSRGQWDVAIRSCYKIKN